MVGLEFLGDTDWVNDLLFAIIAGIAYIGASIFLPRINDLFSIAFSLGVPQVMGLSVAFSGFVTIFVAPILEELAFRGAGNEILNKAFNLPVPIVIILSSAAFGAFHWFVYTKGSYVSVVSPLVGAFVFGMIASIIAIQRNSLLPSMFLHAMINSFIFFQDKLVRFG